MEIKELRVTKRLESCFTLTPSHRVQRGAMTAESWQPVPAESGREGRKETSREYLQTHVGGFAHT